MTPPRSDAKVLTENGAWWIERATGAREGPYRTFEGATLVVAGMTAERLADRLDAALASESGDPLPLPLLRRMQEARARVRRHAHAPDGPAAEEDKLEADAALRHYRRWSMGLVG